MVVLKELILNSFYFGEGVVVIKELIFKKFLCWEDVAVLKELIFNIFYFEGGCGGLERANF